ncbi:NAD-binding protein [Fomitiporia mediterranea MF3/22]|uniref:NAD-binding protein n=1 Tax=Fomitiporia mediterranea (strain MF3/22) TaxID=694068 RepID=UPI0004408A1B|nr:NAD-binding protein [Fomitiporia mediterranea MF3/22]EJD01910.1 NAD-binding protein [Fomitiporia mediterranea MF3/22]
MSSGYSPTSIAILGAGIFAKEAHLPAIAALGNRVLLRAVYSRSHKSASELAEAAKSTLKLEDLPKIYSDDTDPGSTLDALLARPDIDAVIVVLPITTQPNIVIKCLGAGKHVLSEKPVAPDVKSGLELIASYEKDFKPKGLIWRVAENYEAEPGYRRAAEVIRQGKIGEIRFFRLTAVGYVGKDSKWYKTPWRTVPDYQGGFLLDGGVHSVALLRMLLPEPMKQVTSFASLSRPHLPPHDTVTALISCTSSSDKASEPKDKKAHGIFELSFAAPAPSRSKVGNTTIITGDKGWLQIATGVKVGEKNVVRVTVHVVTHEQEKEGDELEEKEEIIEEEQKSIKLEISSFLDALKGTDDGIGNPRAALVDVAVIQAALTSEGVPVDLDKLVKSG